MGGHSHSSSVSTPATTSTHACFGLGRMRFEVHLAATIARCISVRQAFACAGFVAPVSSIMSLIRRTCRVFIFSAWIARAAVVFGPPNSRVKVKSGMFTAHGNAA
jgi:hypothetical protein